MPDFKIGTVAHFYSKIGVAIIDLQDNLGVGDKIKFVKDKEKFAQEVTSMQIEHQEIKQAKKGQTIGLKVDKPVKEKAVVYRID